MHWQGALLPYLPSVKKLTLVLLALFLIVFVASSFLVTRTSHPKSTSKKDAKTTKPANATELYFADLEYDPKMQTITQLRTGKTTGQLRRSSKPVSTTSGQFIYKLDVHSKQNKLLEEGWEAIPAKAITNSKGTMSFRVNAKYVKDAVVRVLTTDNKLFWVGVIQ